MNLGIFVGTYMDQKLDSKGRLSVPAKWRERLGTEFFMVCMNLRGSTCIKLYPQDEFMHCVEALDDGTANEVYEKNKIFFSNAEECTLDTMFNGLRTDTNFLDLMDAGKKEKPASEEQTAGV